MRRLNLKVLFSIILEAILIILFFLTTIEEIKILLLILIFAVIILLLLYFMVHYLIPDYRFKKHLSQMHKDLPIDHQKKMYLQIYNEYCKLSETIKQEYYDSVMQLRKQIANHMANRNQLEQHLQNEGTMAQKKKRLKEMHTILAQLPTPDREKYTLHVHHYSDQLEGK